MKKSNGALTPVVFTLIIMTDVIESVAELFLKKGTTATGISDVTFANLSEFLMLMISGPGFWIGFSCYALNFFLWIAVLSQVDLSVAFPTGSTSYIIVALLSIIFLGETVTVSRWAGIIFIIIGIYYISRSTSNGQEI